MLAEAKAHITTALVAAGIPTKRIMDGASNLADTKVVPRAVIHFRMADERITQDGTQVGWWVADQKRIYRRRLWRRELDVMIEVTGESDVAVNDYVSGFYAAAGYGFLDTGDNWVDIKAGQSEWHEDKAKTSKRTECVMQITLRGGIYQDAEYPLATEIEETGEVE